MNCIRQALYAAPETGGKKELKKQASDLESFTLACTEFPIEALNLIVEIISTKELFSKSGIDNFIVKLSTDMYRLSDDQKSILLTAICNKYSEYTELEWCWLLGDLIAGNYDASIAMQVFREIFPSATKEGKEGVALGLDVIYKQSGRDPKLEKEIKKILNPS